MLQKNHINLLAVATSTVFGLSTGYSQIIGPSTSTAPYLLPGAPGVQTISILTVGDYVNLKDDGTPYFFVGIPDGMGAWENGNGTFNLLINHELGGSVGAVRAHGQKGSFVSNWTIKTKDLKVIKGSDLIQSTVVRSGTGLMSRLCSGDLAGFRSFYDTSTGLGTKSTLFLSGEESGAEGRAFAHIAKGDYAGTSFELPSLGKFSWENAVAHPATGQKTVVVGLDDSGGGQLYIYVGNKRRSGDAISDAGLSGGNLYGLRIPGVAAETRADGVFGATTFELYPFGDVSTQSGAWLQAESAANGVTGFLRPEDGSWDPNNPNDFYFVTTDTYTNGRSRLWRLRFDDARTPELGGEITMLLDGTEGQKMMDNITVDSRGRVIIQEDIGGQASLGKIWCYDIATDTLNLVAEHNPYFFDPVGATQFLTQDEESSGVIEAPFLGPNWYLINDQAHYSIGGELVEGGQLLAIYIP